MSPLGDVFKKIGKGALKVADVGAKANIPVLTQIDQVADAVKTIQPKRNIDKEQIGTVLAGLNELKAVASQPVDKSVFQSKKAILAFAGIVVALLAPHIGLNESQAAELTDAITQIVSIFVATQGVVDMTARLKG